MHDLNVKKIYNFLRTLLDYLCLATATLNFSCTEYKFCFYQFLLSPPLCF